MCIDYSTHLKLCKQKRYEMFPQVYNLKGNFCWRFRSSSFNLAFSQLLTGHHQLGFRRDELKERPEVHQSHLLARRLTPASSMTLGDDVFFFSENFGPTALIVSRTIPQKRMLGWNSILERLTLFFLPFFG